MARRHHRNRRHSDDFDPVAYWESRPWCIVCGKIKTRTEPVCHLCREAGHKSPPPSSWSSDFIKPGEAEPTAIPRSAEAPEKLEAVRREPAVEPAKCEPVTPISKPPAPEPVTPAQAKAFPTTERSVGYQLLATLIVLSLVLFCGWGVFAPLFRSGQTASTGGYAGSTTTYYSPSPRSISTTRNTQRNEGEDEPRSVGNRIHSNDESGARERPPSSSHAAAPLISREYSSAPNPLGAPVERPKSATIERTPMENSEELVTVPVEPPSLPHAPARRYTRTISVGAQGEARVVKVIDGDTLHIEAGGERIVVRLAGIDAPESDQSRGIESRTVLAMLTGESPFQVCIVGEDRYGRALAFLIYPDGSTVNHALVETGNAWAYRSGIGDDTLAHAEATARQQRRGLWADPEPIEPAEWRSRKAQPVTPTDPRFRKPLNGGGWQEQPLKIVPVPRN